MQPLTMYYSNPHRRYNPLKDEWVLVSPQRTLRPWQGKQEIIQKEKRSLYDPNCYMCPGNKRANRLQNPRYENTFVFSNDFPAITDNTNSEYGISTDIFQVEPARGKCRVVSFSPKHDLTLADMTEDQIGKVINTWTNELEELNKKYNWVQIFENKGELMGCSNPHPHGQIWASNFIPNEIKKEDIQQQKYFKQNNSVLLLDYVKEEQNKKERIVLENENWLILVPFWATWPFETLLLPKSHHPNFIPISDREKKNLSEIMKKLLVLYDKLFDSSMPYSMGWHFAPNNQSDNSHWQLHAHYYPPLLRSATVKKFMVGYEMLAETQRDITPEEATERLREVI